MKYDFGIMKIDISYNLWMAYGYNNSDTGREIVNTAGYPGGLLLGFSIALRICGKCIDD